MSEASEERQVEAVRTAPSAWVALLRIFAGAYFLRAGLPKLLDFSKSSQQIEEQLRVFVTTPHEWYGNFLQATVIPHAGTFAYLVAVGEVAVGVLVLLGVFTGAASLIGAFMTLNYYFASAGVGAPSEGLNLYATVVFIVLIGTQAGRRWGIDALLARTVPRMKILW